MAMAKFVGRRVYGTGAVIVAALILSACGGDTPEAMQQVLVEAAPALAYTDDEHATCAGEAILTHVGFDQLAADGHTSDTVAAEPSTIVAIVEKYESDELQSALTECLDVDTLFRGHVANQLGVANLNCDATFRAGDPLVDQYLDDRFAGEDQPIEIADTAANRDVFRPCLTETAFSKAFDVDLASDLGPAITAALPKQVSARPCAGERIVENFGAEELNALGISVDSAAIDLEELDLGEDDNALIVAAVTECSDLESEQRVELLQEQPSHGECALNAIVDEWTAETVKLELGVGKRLAAHWLLEDALADCWIERAESIVGRSMTEAERSSAQQHSRLIVRWTEDDPFVATPEMLNCAVLVAIGDVGIAGVDSTFDQLLAANTDDEVYTAIDEFGALMAPARRACDGDSVYSLLEYYRVGFSAETIDCVARELGGADELAGLLVRGFTEDELSRADLDVWATITNDSLDAAETCRSGDEIGLVQELEDYYFGSLGESEIQTF